MAVFTRRRSESDNDESWLSVSDLMAGLMVIFLFIAITYIRPLAETKQKKIFAALNMALSGETNNTAGSK